MLFTLTGRAFANIAEEDPMEEEDGHGDPVVWDSDSESDDIEEDEDSDDSEVTGGKRKKAAAPKRAATRAPKGKATAKTAQAKSATPVRAPTASASQSGSASSSREVRTQKTSGMQPLPPPSVQPGPAAARPKPSGSAPPTAKATPPVVASASAVKTSSGVRRDRDVSSAPTLGLARVQASTSKAAVRSTPLPRIGPPKATPKVSGHATTRKPEPTPTARAVENPAQAPKARPAPQVVKHTTPKQPKVHAGTAAQQRLLRSELIDDEAEEGEPLSDEDSSAGGSADEHSDGDTCDDKTPEEGGTQGIEDDDELSELSSSEGDEPEPGGDRVRSSPSPRNDTPPPPVHAPSRGKPVFVRADTDSDEEDQSPRMQPSSPIPRFARAGKAVLVAPSSPPFRFDNQELQSPPRPPRARGPVRVTDVQSTLRTLNFTSTTEEEDELFSSSMVVDEPEEMFAPGALSERDSWMPSESEVRPTTPEAGPSGTRLGGSANEEPDAGHPRRGSQGECHVIYDMLALNRAHRFTSEEEEAQGAASFGVLGS